MHFPNVNELGIQVAEFVISDMHVLFNLYKLCGLKKYISIVDD